MTSPQKANSSFCSNKTVKKQNNLFPRERKLIFHEFNPSFFHHFLRCWFTASSLHPQPSLPVILRKDHVCCLLVIPSPGYPTLAVNITFPFSLLSLLLFSSYLCGSIPSLQYHVLFEQKTLPLTKKSDSFTPLNSKS